MKNERLSAQLQWQGDGSSRIPFWVYDDESVYKEELQRIFYRSHWNYVGLEAEVPNPGDFKRTAIGERSVILARDLDGEINVIENVCAHRGMAFCRKRSGNTKDFTCPYHQWNFSLQGNLQGVPFLRGFKEKGSINGGMPKDFKRENHGLTKLKTTIRNGVVFASFDHDIESFEDYLGSDILAYFDRVFDGRKLKVLGYNKQRIPGNWKLMQENIKDPYHPGLLHTWFVTFGLWRADNTSKMTMDPHYRHAAMASARSGKKTSSATNVSSFKESMVLNDQSFLDIKPEPWWNGYTAVMLTLFPGLIVQQQVNSLSMRHIQPSGCGSFNFVWTHFGYAEDNEEMTQRRLTQANLFGPSGFVSADDGEAIEHSQESFVRIHDRSTLAEMDGVDVRETQHMVTETLIRGMYRYWRKVMGV